MMNKSRKDTLFLGIDAGGTKTHCVALDADGTVRGEGVGPAGNFMHLEPSAVVDAISAARNGALNAAGSSHGAVTAVCVCLAGFGPADVPRARALIDPALAPAKTIYARDLDAALAAVCGAGAGLVVVAGTGSVSYGRNSAGETHRAGGWGYMVGDEGSAFWLGCQAIRKTLQGFDGRARRGPLFESVRDRSQTSDPVSLERKVYYERWKPADYAAYAPLVTAAAATGDESAVELVRTAAKDLATLGSAVIRTLGITEGRCGVVGSLWKAGAILREPFEEALHATVPEIAVVDPGLSPAEGAALLALEHAGITLNPEQVQNPQRLADPTHIS